MCIPCIVATLLSISMTPRPPWEVGGGGKEHGYPVILFYFAPPKEGENHSVDLFDYVLWGWDYLGCVPEPG